MAVTPSAPTCRPSLDEVRALAAEHDLVPVVTELLADCDTPVSAFLRLGMAPGSFLLESVEGGERLARYSFLGVSPMCTVTLDGGVATVVDALGAVSSEPYSDPLVPVEREVGRYRVAPLPGVAPPFAGGAIGFLSYEAATRYERIPVAPRDPLGVPEGWFAVVDTLIAFDHVSHRMLLLTHARTPPGADVERAYDDAVARLDDLRSRLRSPRPPPAGPSDDSVADATEGHGGQT